MAHQIMGNRFMARQVPAWHMLGTVVDSCKTATEALAIIEGNDPVIMDLLPFQVNIPDYGVWIPDDTYNIVRRPTKDDPTPRLFGQVKDRYSLLQNSQLASIFDILTNNTSWGMETVGLLDYGKTIFFVATDQKEHTIAGDKVGTYFTMSDCRNGKDSLELMVGAIRVVCANTLSLAKGVANSTIKIPHHSDLSLETSWRMEVITKMINAGNSMVEALQSISDIPVLEDNMINLAESLTPLRKKTRASDMITANDSRLQDRAEQAIYAMEAYNDRMLELRSTMVDNYNYLVPVYGNTGWSAYNAVTGALDHQSSKSTQKSMEVAAQRTMFDQGFQDMRDKAYEYILNTK